MKLFFILFLCTIFNLESRALTYKLHNDRLNPADFNESDSFFKNLGFSEILNLNAQEILNNPYDRIYVQNEKVIFVRSGLELSDNNIVGQLKELSHGFVLHINDSNKNSDTAINKKSGKIIPKEKKATTVIAFYFYHFNESQVKVIYQNWKAQSKWSLLKTFKIIKRAEAQSLCSSAVNNSAKTCQDGQDLEWSTIKETFHKCSTSAKEEVVGRVDSVREQFLAVLNADLNKSIDVNQFWNKMTGLYDTMIELSQNVKPLAHQFLNVVKNLHPQLQVTLMCSWLTGKAIDSLTPGGYAKVIVQLKEKLQALGLVQKTLEKLSHLYDKYSKSPLVTKYTQKVSACLF